MSWPVLWLLAIVIGFSLGHVQCAVKGARGHVALGHGEREPVGTLSDGPVGDAAHHVAGHTLSAKAGFDLERFKPQLECVEAHPEVRQVILEYFAERNYVLAGKYVRVDDRNLWFVPRGTVVEPFPKNVSDQWTN